MDRVTLGGGHRALFVHGIAGDIEDAAQHAFAHGHGNRRAGVGDGHAALEAFGRGHRDGAHPVFAEVLLDLEGELGRRWPLTSNSISRAS